MKKTTLNIITPLSRMENLPLLCDNLANAQKNTTIFISWYVAPDFKIMDHKKYWNFMSNEIYHNKQPFPYTIPMFSIFSSTNYNNMGGHYARNRGISNIYVKTAFNDYENHLIYFLDDDNILHPDFIPYISDFDFEKNDVLIFSQLNKDNSLRLKACEGCAKVGLIDTAMFVFNEKILNGLCFKEGDYCADGLFAEQLVKRANKVYYEPKPLCYYNKLR